MDFIYLIILFFIKGGSLENKLDKIKNKEIPQFEESQMYESIVKLIDAVHFLHTNNVIHRDIQPAYIIHFKKFLLLK